MVSKHREQLNHIHIAAAIVRLAKLVSVPGSAQSLSARSPDDDLDRTTSNSSASTSAPGVSSNGRVGQPRQKRITSSSGSHAASKPAHSLITGEGMSLRRPVDSSSNGAIPQSHAPNMSSSSSASRMHSAPAMMDLPAIKHLVDELGSMFLLYSEDKVGPRQYANVTWALGKLSYTPSQQLVVDIMQRMSANNHRRLSSSITQELTNFAHGLASMNFTDESAWAAIRAVAKTRTDYKPQELANMAWAVATTHPDSQLLKHLAEQASGTAHRFTVPELVNMLWSCAKAACYHQPLFTLAASVLQLAAATSAMNSQDIGNTAWAYAKVRHKHRGLFDALSSAMLAAPAPASPVPAGQAGPGGEHSTSPAVLSTAAPASQLPSHSDYQQQPPLAALVNGSSLLDSSLLGSQQLSGLQLDCLGQHVDGHVKAALSPPTASSTTTSSSSNASLLQRSTSQELCNVLWACASLGYHHPQLVRSVMQELSSRGPALPPQSVANAVWAAAKLKVKDDKAVGILLEAAALQVSRRVSMPA